MNTDWKTKIAHLRATLDQGDNVTVAGLGDSLTYGWMVGQGYFERFVSILEAHWPEAGINSINAGIPGDTALGGLRRIDTVLKEKPTLVLIQFGLNDLFSGVDLTSFEESYQQITTRVTDASAIPILVISSPLPNPSEQEKATLYYDIIRNLGHKLGIPVADTDLHFRNSLEMQNNPESLFLDDGSHPSDQGHHIMADVLRYLVVESL
jgi:acyl-CoA thioesterase-1